MKTSKILRNIFFSISLLSASGWLLGAGMNGGFLNFSSTLSLPLSPSIITFDAPGAGTDPGKGTLAFAINPAGTIAGQYFDSSPVTHSFLRARDGTFTEFDAPGGGTGPYQGTFCSAINLKGSVTGFVRDS